MSSRDKVVCGVCNLEVVKKNLTTHFQRRHPDKSINWKLPWAKKNLDNIFKKAEHSNSNVAQIGSGSETKSDESLNVIESSNQNLPCSSKDSFDDRAVKRPRYDDQKGEKSVTDVLQAIHSKCLIICIYFLLVFLFELSGFSYKYRIYSII